MSNSLRDQLVGLGFKPAAESERRSRSAPRAPGGAKPASGKPPNRSGATPSQQRAEMDLAKAYAMRAQREKEERAAAELVRQQEAQRRREGKQRVAELLKRASLNDAAAEIARHFEYGGKIRRIYVTSDQLKALNAGELGVVQNAGRYHVVSAAHAREAESLLPGALALLVDPTVTAGDECYDDPGFRVPDDLIW